MDEEDLVRAERFIKQLNVGMSNGFDLTKQTIKAIGDILQCRKSVREERTWGIQPIEDVEQLEIFNRNKPPERQVKQRYKVVANAQFFHPKYIVATELTKEEAEALIKLL